MAKDALIEIVPYDPSWPALFEREAAAITEVIGQWVTGGVHHIGSTAVPGLAAALELSLGNSAVLADCRVRSLAAKPVIDIMAGVDDLEQTRDCIELLGGLHYCYAPYLAQTMHWFCKPSPSRRTHHLHLVPTASQRFADVLAFRDHLRGHAAVAAEYEALKRRLATEHADDREAYTEAKGELVARVVRQSRMPAGPDAWGPAGASLGELRTEL